MWYFFRSGRFTSLSMICALLSLQTYVCATIHLNRGFPACAAFTKDEAKSLKRGQSLYATSADKKILAEAWKDSKPVYWLSSAIAESTSNTVVRRCKAQSLTIGWHAVIASYNGGMDGLDDVDASRSYFAMHFRRLKWCWLNLFFWLLEIALNNALVLYNAMVEFKSLRQKGAKEFRHNLSELLVFGSTNDMFNTVSDCFDDHSSSSASASYILFFFFLQVKFNEGMSRSKANSRFFWNTCQ